MNLLSLLRSSEELLRQLPTLHKNLCQQLGRIQAPRVPGMCQGVTMRVMRLSM